MGLLDGAWPSSPAPEVVSGRHTHWPLGPRVPGWWSMTSGLVGRFPGRRGSAAQSVVDEITSAGGEAVVSGANVADWNQAAGLIQTAIDSFGGLDVLVNNAGIVRDRMIANTSEAEFDAVVAVHLKGHFATTRHAGAYWRGLVKAGKEVHARIINTSSGAGLGQRRSGQLQRRQSWNRRADAGGRRRNGALRRHRQRHRPVGAHPHDRDRLRRDDGQTRVGFRHHGPGEHLAAGGLARQRRSADVTGRVFEVEGGVVRVAEGWMHGPQADKGARWDPAELGPVVSELLAQARRPEPVYGA